MSNAVLRLIIQGLGPVPSFKNNKMLTRGKLITDPVKQRWMDQAARSIEFQLRSISQTIEDATLTESVARSLMYWSDQFDDSASWIPELIVKAERCAKGQEGATIIIELIENRESVMDNLSSHGQKGRQLSDSIHIRALSH